MIKSESIFDNIYDDADDTWIKGAGASDTQLAVPEKNSPSIKVSAETRNQFNQREKPSWITRVLNYRKRNPSGNEQTIDNSWQELRMTDPVQQKSSEAPPKTSEFIPPLPVQILKKPDSPIAVPETAPPVVKEKQPATIYDVMKLTSLKKKNEQWKTQSQSQIDFYQQTKDLFERALTPEQIQQFVDLVKLLRTAFQFSYMGVFQSGHYPIIRNEEGTQDSVFPLTERSNTHRGETWQFREFPGLSSLLEEFSLGSVQDLYITEVAETYRRKQGELDGYLSAKQNAILIRGEIMTERSRPMISYLYLKLNKEADKNILSQVADLLSSKQLGSLQKSILLYLIAEHVCRAVIVPPIPDENGEVISYEPINQTKHRSEPNIDNGEVGGSFPVVKKVNIMRGK